MGRFLPSQQTEVGQKVSFNIVRLLSRLQFPICLVLPCAPLWQSVSLVLQSRWLASGRMFPPHMWGISSFSGVDSGIVSV